ncbi:MAG: DUF5034 domain-containing protein [Prevotellaceae bacterium]|nr:DUF5034 domain-containing protein [Prevotellaceae bacterium]
MKPKTVICLLLCSLFLLTNVTGCFYDWVDEWEENTYINEGYREDLSVTPNKLSDIALLSYDNSGDVPRLLTENRCPGRAYRLHIIPILELGGMPRNSIDPQVIAVRIITLNDFNEEYPAGSDISTLFHRLNSTHTGIGTPIRFINEGEYYPLFLTAHPVAGTYQFRVEFVCSDEQTLVRDTPVLQLY